MPKLEFRKSYQYEANDRNGIVIPVTLRLGDAQVNLDTKLDTGAEHRLFQRDYGEILGLTIKEGRRMVFRTVNSEVVAFGKSPRTWTKSLPLKKSTDSSPRASMNWMRAKELMAKKRSVNSGLTPTRDARRASDLKMVSPSLAVLAACFAIVVGTVHTFQLVPQGFILIPVASDSRRI